ncbi:MAG: hypothetical protein IKR92_02550 [Alphaproteobacteria bacterium]|nr:hypothetical protein [Alphaproteobacteria bacterium]
MVEAPNSNQPRKLRKIKRVKVQPTNQPTSFGTPTKVNYTQSEQSSVQSPDSFFADNGDNVIYDNNGEAESIHFITDAELYNEHTESIKDILMNKNVQLLMLIACLIGALLGYIAAPRSRTVAGHGLEGVVFNSDVPKGRSRCGLVEYQQPCVLYIVNPKTQEVSGKDFYATAAKWTGREAYMIEINNMHYGQQRIKPGQIAAINIPAL